MNVDEPDIEQRLRGALRELGEVGGVAQSDNLGSSVIEHDPSRRTDFGAFGGRARPQRSASSPRGRRATVALAAVAAVATIATGAAVFAQPNDGGNKMAPADGSKPAVPSVPVSSPAAPGTAVAVNEIADSLTPYEDAPGFGKVVVDYDQAQVTIYWKGTPPLEVAELDGTRARGVRIVLLPATFSAQELADAGARAGRYMNDTYGPGIFSSSSAQPDMSGIFIAVLQTWSGDLTRLRNELQTATGGIPVDITTTDSGFVPADD